MVYALLSKYFSTSIAETCKGMCQYMIIIAVYVVATHT